MSSDLPSRPAAPAPVVAQAISSEYRDWLLQIKSRFRCVQLKAAVAVNTALLQFHWELGADIVNQQPRFAWGAGFLNQLSADLMREFPQVKGFSKRQLELIRQWHLFWRDAVVAPLGADNTAKQPVSQILAIPWGICKSKDRLVAEYALATFTNRWACRPTPWHGLYPTRCAANYRASRKSNAKLAQRQAAVIRRTLEMGHEF